MQVRSESSAVQRGGFRIMPDVGAGTLGQTMYKPVVNSRTKKEIFPGLEYGSETGWSTFGGPQPFGIGTQMYQFMVFQNQTWDYKTLNFDSDMATVDKIENGANQARSGGPKRHLPRRPRGAAGPAPRPQAAAAGCGCRLRLAGLGRRLGRAGRRAARAARRARCRAGAAGRARARRGGRA